MRFPVLNKTDLPGDPLPQQVDVQNRPRMLNEQKVRSMNTLYELKKQLQPKNHIYRKGTVIFTCQVVQKLINHIRNKSVSERTVSPNLRVYFGILNKKVFP